MTSDAFHYVVISQCTVKEMFGSYSSPAGMFCMRSMNTLRQKSSRILRKGLNALSSGEAISFLEIPAVVPCSSSLATHRWRNVHNIPDPTGYLIFATKQIWRKLHTAFSKVSISEMKTSPSRMRSKTTFLKQN